MKKRKGATLNSWKEKVLDAQFVREAKLYVKIKKWK